MRKYRILRYCSNCLCLAYALFLFLFSLDFIDENTDIDAYIVMPFFIHSIPSILILLILMITLRKDLLRGILLICVSIAFFFFFHIYNNIELLYIVFFPLVIISLLYFAVHYFRLKDSNNY
ncbi:MAG: hypothetical protein A2X12_00490 [Bacteroidetes bacterium GWE2_29_8]|nr:MAG: hypothetical protein A2X12_00490 [Bacteroidetes bacterium GWE2_29_8]OFY19644.1 MAG: hypothetical protein A2X02_09625 [Bacteroidetes bacterium GWF2_29_10]